MFKAVEDAPRKLERWVNPPNKHGLARPKFIPAWKVVDTEGNPVLVYVTKSDAKATAKAWNTKGRPNL